MPKKRIKIHNKEKYIRCGSKTEAGTNRLVPINEKIFPLIKNRFEKSNSEYLIEHNGSSYKYRTYRDRFDTVLSQLNMKHTPHECRHTFTTLLDNVGANERAITKIMGHTNFKTTEKFYTHKEISDLKKAIDLI